MEDRALIQLITRRIVERIEDEPPCSGCALRSCRADLRACDAAIRQEKIPIGVSARHVHVTQKDLEALYGQGYELSIHAPLYQPDAFAAKETLTVVGRRMRSIEGVRILGPVREYSQVELAQTDAIRLGLHPPIRDSGDLEDSEPISLIGPAGSVFLKEGAICATRHIHMNPETASSLSVHSTSRLKVRVPGERALILENIRPKISSSYVLQMHLDTDDSNAAGLRGGEAVELLQD